MHTGGEESSRRRFRWWSHPTTTTPPRRHLAIKWSNLPTSSAWRHTRGKPSKVTCLRLFVLMKVLNNHIYFLYDLCALSMFVLWVKNAGCMMTWKKSSKNWLMEIVHLVLKLLYDLYISILFNLHMFLQAVENGLTLKCMTKTSAPLQNGRWSSEGFGREAMESTREEVSFASVVIL